MVQRVLQLFKTHRKQVVKETMDEPGLSKEDAEKRLLQLFEKYRKQLVKGAMYKYGLSREDAEELVSDAFLKCIQLLRNGVFVFYSDGTTLAYISKIIFNEKSKYLRRKVKHQATQQEETDLNTEETVRAYIRLEQQEFDHEKLRLCLEQLTERCQCVLKHWQEYTNREIADHCGLPNERAVAQAIYDCRRRLIEIYARLF
jgi:RNA polymerase sigma factor (sigma-70 family)